VLTLVLGGTKSGKSSFAARLAGESGSPVTVIATGTATDDEMRRRIAAHRAARPVTWTVIEEPLAIGSTPVTGAVLLDSVDSLLFNLMESAGGAEATFVPPTGAALLDRADAELQALEARATVIAASAEVGQSLLPLSPYGRAFTDLLGLLNQRLAARAARCFLMVAGIPLPLHRARDADL
jgi:adenosylcobinamide kinase / adenosylcobinamide-phosphate guanylyltransferase